MKNNFDVSIRRTVERLDSSERNLSPIELDVKTADNELMKQAGLTPFGYKVLINTLCTCITEIALAAKQQGMSEGEIIKDAINQIKSKFIDPSRVEPTSRIHRRIKARNRKSKRK